MTYQLPANPFFQNFKETAMLAAVPYILRLNVQTVSPITPQPNSMPIPSWKSIFNCKLKRKRDGEPNLNAPSASISNSDQDQTRARAPNNGHIATDAPNHNVAHSADVEAEDSWDAHLRFLEEEERKKRDREKNKEIEIAKLLRLKAEDEIVLSGAQGDRRES